MATKYFLLSTNADTTCDTAETNRDMSTAIGGAGTQTTDGTQVESPSWDLVLAFDVDVSGDNPATGNHDVSIDVSVAPASEIEYRFRLQAVDDSGCGVDNSSAYSSVFTDTGIKTLSATNLTWAAGSDRLRLSIEARRTAGHGNKAITIRIGDVDSFVNAPWTAAVAVQPVIPFAGGRRPIAAVPPSLSRSQGFLPTIAPAPPPLPASPVIPVLYGRRPAKQEIEPQRGEGFFPLVAPAEPKTRYYLRHENFETACPVGPKNADLNKVKGSPNTVLSTSTASTSFLRMLVLDVDPGINSPGPGNHEVSIDVASMTADTEYRFRLEWLNPGCSATRLSGFSPTFDSTGIKKAILFLDYSATAVLLRLRVEIRSTGSGSKNVTLNTGDDDSFVLAPWSPRHGFVPVVTAQRVPDPIQPLPVQSRFFPLVAPAPAAPVVAKPVVPIIAGRAPIPEPEVLPAPGFFPTVAPAPAVLPANPVIELITGRTPEYVLGEKDARSQFLPLVPPAPAAPAVAKPIVRFVTGRAPDYVLEREARSQFFALVPPAPVPSAASPVIQIVTGRTPDYALEGAPRSEFSPLVLPPEVPSTTRYYPRSENADTTCDSGPAPHDMRRTRGSPRNAQSDPNDTDVFLEKLSFDIDVSGDSPVTSIHRCELDVGFVSPGGEWRFRLQAVNDVGCVVEASSPYSDVFDDVTPALKTADLALQWPVTSNRLRLSIEVRRKPGEPVAPKSIILRTGHGIFANDSWVSAVWTLLPIRSVPVITARGFAGVVADIPEGRGFFPVVPPAAPPLPANAVIPFVRGARPFPYETPDVKRSAFFPLITPAPLAVVREPGDLRTERTATGSLRTDHLASLRLRSERLSSSSIRTEKQ